MLPGQRLSQGAEGLPLQPAACFSWQQGERVSPNMLPTLEVMLTIIYLVSKCTVL